MKNFIGVRVILGFVGPTNSARGFKYNRPGFLFAAGFPKGYDNRSIELLFHLASSGPAAGKYVLLQHDADTELPRGYDLKQIRNRHTIQVRQGGRIDFDAPPSESIRRAIADRWN